MEPQMDADKRGLREKRLGNYVIRRSRWRKRWHVFRIYQYNLRDEWLATFSYDHDAEVFAESMTEVEDDLRREKYSMDEILSEYEEKPPLSF